MAHFKIAAFKSQKGMCGCNDLGQWLRLVSPIAF